MTSNLCEIEKLVELFSLNKNEELDDDEDKEKSEECNTKRSSNKTINKEKDVTNKQQNPYSKIEPSLKKEIFNPDDEGSDELYFDETSSETGLKDWKQSPKWDISYRQSVTASDAFLGMGFKNPSTASCENMIIAIHLPEEKRQNIDLKIEKECLVLMSPKFFLKLKLPHPVDPKRGNAQFNREEEKLIVTLIMDRELDVLNF